MKKDYTEITIETVLKYMRSLPKEERMNFVEELIFAAAIESGNRHEALGVVRWAEDNIMNAYKDEAAKAQNKTETEVDSFFVEKSTLEN